MRESIGGGWILTIVVLFIVLFSGYLAVSINYSKAFKVKNFILSTIERREGYTEYVGNAKDLETMGQAGSTVSSDSSAQTEIYAYLKAAGYYTTVIDAGYCESNDLGETIEGGFCLKHICADMGSGSGNYYKVTTFLKIEFPLVDFVFKIPISGETKVIYYDTETADCGTSY